MIDIYKTTPAWFVKDYADGWIKYYSVDAAISCAMDTGAIMRYRVDGTPPPACETRAAARVEDDWREIDENTPVDEEILVAAFYHDGSVEQMFMTKITKCDYKAKGRLHYLRPRGIHCDSCGDTARREAVTHWRPIARHAAKTEGENHG